MMIRHSVACLAMGLTLVLAGPAFAQTAVPVPAPSTSHIAAGRDVVVASGIAQSFESIYGEFRDRIRQIVGSTRPELQKDMNEVIDRLKPESDRKLDEIVALSADIFAKRMSEADLKEIATFFRSPVGQRYNAVRPQAMDEMFNLLQPWSVQTSNFLFDRFSEEMKKRGHQL